MVTLYNAVSIDGQMARKDGSEDFIPDDAWNEYIEILCQYDVAVMGRKTYETLQTYPMEMLESFEALPIKRLVLSRINGFIPKVGYSALLEMNEIPTAGENILITSGPTLNTAALRAGIIDFVMLNVVPVTVGDGIPVFYDNPELILISTDHTPSGRKLCTYKIQNRNNLTHTPE